jgi:glucose/arabinose dehydrogenase
LLLATACSDDAAATKKDAAVPRDTMDQPGADAPPLVACTPVNGTTITLRQLESVSGGAMLATSPPNDGRLFVVEKQGRIRIYENEVLRTQEFLDVSELAGFATGSEQGLLGLAFHPNYAVNRQLFVYYTLGNANVIARYYVSETDYNKADPAGEVILSIPDFASNHNGGMIEFGNDGYLYIGTGDGGDGGDPCRNGQQLLRDGSSCPNKGGVNREPLLGKILRIDVDTTASGKLYGIPADNPYADGVAGEPEIFIRGLRNPWRWSFDRATGDLYVGDVGQEEWEELTVLTPAQQSGANLGWRLCEGIRTYPPGAACTEPGVFLPQLVKSQPNIGPSDGWESIIAGQVYRGTCFPDLIGDFYFSDYSKHPLMRGRFDMGAFSATQVGNAPTGVASIHADARGELFLTTVGGAVYQIEAGP